MDSAIVNTLGLCSGVGMLEEAVRIGCEYLGWRAKPTCLCEWEAYAASVLLARMEDASMEPCPIWCGDMRDFDGTPFRGVVDILTAGLPCPAFSVAGKQAGLDDHRAWGSDDSPIPQFLRIVSECRPALVFVENVPPFVRGGFFRPVGEELSRLGYEVECPLFVTAKSVGASHKRERVFILAHDRHKYQHVQQRRARSEPSGSGGNVAITAQRELWEPSRRDGQPDGSDGAVGDTERTEPGCGNGQERQTIERTSVDGLFAPGPNANWRDIPEAFWPAVEPGFRLSVDGMAVVVDESRADQLRCSGNGVVATCAAVAFVELVRRVVKDYLTTVNGYTRTREKEIQ